MTSWSHERSRSLKIRLRDRQGDHRDFQATELSHPPNLRRLEEGSSPEHLGPSYQDVFLYQTSCGHSSQDLAHVSSDSWSSLNGSCSQVLVKACHSHTQRTHQTCPCPYRLYIHSERPFLDRKRTVYPQQAETVAAPSSLADSSASRSALKARSLYSSRSPLRFCTSPRQTPRTPDPGTCQSPPRSTRHRLESACLLWRRDHLCFAIVWIAVRNSWSNFLSLWWRRASRRRCRR